MLKYSNLLGTVLLCILLSTTTQAQNPKGFDKMINRMIKGTVPVISSDGLQELMEGDLVLLDTRESNEFNASHILGAVHVGYDELDEAFLRSIPIGSTVVTYCSIGYRSEKVGQKLMALGHSKVFNLKGGIFDWANNGRKLEADQQGQVHGYNQKWSKWLNPDRTSVILDEKVR